MQPDPATDKHQSQRLPVNPRRHKVAPEHRKRVATACNSCNVRRTKCSGDKPCTQCIASQRECVYPKATPKVSISKDELKSLRRRVEALDKVLQDVVPDADKRRELLHNQSISGSAMDSPSSSTPSLSQPLSPVKTEATTTTEDDPPGSSAMEGQLLHDNIGTARFHGETSQVVFVDDLKAFLRSLLPANEVGFLSTNIGRCSSSDSKPLPAPDANPLWLPPPNTTRTMLKVLRSFIQDGTDEQPWASGGMYWWGNLTSVPSIPSSSGHVETDTRSARRLAFYQTALAAACKIASTKPPTYGLDSDRSEPFFARGSTLLGNPLDVSRCSIGEVSVLSLMAYYLLEADRPEAASLYISLAARISMAQGAHRGCVDEKGKRVFWTLYVLDRWVSSLLGRHPAISDDAVLLSLPQDTPGMPSSAGLRAHIELSRISEHITCNLYRVAPSQDSADSSAASREKASFLLEQWHFGLPPALQLSPEGLSNDPATCTLHMYSNHLQILTLRPYLLSAVKSTLSRDGDSPKSRGSAPQWEACIAAALRNMRLARHVATLHQPRRLLHSGLHFVFSAVLCFLLQSLLGTEDLTATREIEFGIELFEKEGQAGNSYGGACASELRELQVLVAKRKGGAVAMEIEQAFEQQQLLIQRQDSISSWQSSEGVSQGSTEGGSLHDEVLSWMDHDWSYHAQLP